MDSSFRAGEHVGGRDKAVFCIVLIIVEKFKY
jgi:hypothetical protein